MRSKRACDFEGYLVERPPLKQVCRFFFRSCSKRLLSPPPEPTPEVPDDWLPWLLNPDFLMVDFDPFDPLWSEFLSGGVSWGLPGCLTGTAEVAGGSSGFL